MWKNYRIFLFFQCIMENEDYINQWRDWIENGYYKIEHYNNFKYSLRLIRMFKYIKK